MMDQYHHPLAAGQPIGNNLFSASLCMRQCSPPKLVGSYPLLIRRAGLTAFSGADIRAAAATRSED